MSPTDEVLFGLVRQWLSKADVDFRAAESLLKDPEPIREAVGFHCQQAVEKYIKAFLVYRPLEFPKTHSLELLLDLISTVCPQMAVDLQHTVELTPFGVEIRYPGDAPEMLPGQEKEYFNLTTYTRAVVTRNLPSELVREPN